MYSASFIDDRPHPRVPPAAEVPNLVREASDAVEGSAVDGFVVRCFRTHFDEVHPRCRDRGEITWTPGFAADQSRTSSLVWVVWLTIMRCNSWSGTPRKVLEELLVTVRGPADPGELFVADLQHHDEGAGVVADVVVGGPLWDPDLRRPIQCFDLRFLVHSQRRPRSPADSGTGRRCR